MPLPNLKLKIKCHLIILYEAEPARGTLELVEAHDDAFDVSRLAEKLVQLLLGRVERHVPDVQRARLFE